MFVSDGFWYVWWNWGNWEEEGSSINVGAHNFEIEIEETRQQAMKQERRKKRQTVWEGRG